MDRRNFLRRTSLALAGGLVVGPQVMEMYEQASLRDDLLDYMARMTHKKVFALGAIPLPTIRTSTLSETWDEVTWHKYEHLNGGAVFWSVPQEEWMDLNPRRFQRMHIGRSEIYVALTDKDLARARSHA